MVDSSGAPLTGNGCPSSEAGGRGRCGFLRRLPFEPITTVCTDARRAVTATDRAHLRWDTSQDQGDREAPRRTQLCRPRVRLLDRQHRAGDTDDAASPSDACMISDASSAEISEIDLLLGRTVTAAAWELVETYASSCSHRAGDATSPPRRLCAGSPARH